MKPPVPSVPIERVRQAVVRAVGESSLRKVSRDVGMSAPGLQHFIDGGEPFAPTVKKLAEWYVRDAATRRGLDEDTAAAALALLLDGVPEAEREDAQRGVLDTIRAAYKKSGAPPPEWLKH